MPGPPECSICTEPYNPALPLLRPRVLPCGHSFHTYCLSEWGRSICCVCDTRFPGDWQSLPFNFALEEAIGPGDPSARPPMVSKWNSATGKRERKQGRTLIFVFNLVTTTGLILIIWTLILFYFLVHTMLYSDVFARNFDNGAVYHGRWNLSTNEPSGLGVWTYANGDQYYGFANLNGCGVKRHADGTVFTGYFIQGQRKGHGIEERPGLFYALLGRTYRKGQWEGKELVSSRKTKTEDLVLAAEASKCGKQAQKLALEEAERAGRYPFLLAWDRFTEFFGF